VKAPANIPPEAARYNSRLLTGADGNTEFAKVMSHELRTPLNVIIGICQFLERDRQTPLSSMHRDAVDRMERNARALLQSINQLLEHLRSSPPL
jgi:signal transduction histidine kinase